MNFQQLMQLMQFINQFKGGNANQQINQMVNSGQVNNDMLQEAQRRADAVMGLLNMFRR